MKRPTLQLMRATLYRWYIWSCGVWGLPCTFIAKSTRRLLPYDFTLTCMQAVSFLWHFPYLYLTTKIPCYSQADGSAPPGLSSLAYTRAMPPLPSYRKYTTISFLTVFSLTNFIIYPQDTAATVGFRRFDKAFEGMARIHAQDYLLK